MTDDVENDLFVQSSHDVCLRYQLELIVPSVNSVLKEKNSL